MESRKRRKKTRRRIQYHGVSASGPNHFSNSNDNFQLLRSFLPRLCPTTTTMSSTPSNLTVPQSQNTAPVIKFRCLYTYDLRRKAKRWQDGFLRFHTFNKRVMVYDNPGNFIGDLHWRQDGGIQDGDEFELDKGVMVEVCESMEKTETDLSKLFEKKTPKESQPTQASNQSLRLSTPLSSTPSQSRPQASLSHLLGIKRTSIGQIASPYQARNSPTQRGDSSERAPKRPRFLPGERAEKPRETSKASPVAINLSEPSPPPGETPPVRPRRDPEIKSSTNLSKRNPVPTRESNRNEKPPSTSNPAPLSTLRPKNPMPETQINTLRLSTDKPRRKLMYQALLPPQASKPPEPVESGKRPNPFSDNQPQSVCL